MGMRDKIWLFDSPPVWKPGSQSPALELLWVISLTNHTYELRDYIMLKNNDKHEFNFSQHVKYMPMGYDKPKVTLQSSSVATV